MASELKPRKDEESSFSFAVRELQRAKTAQAVAAKKLSLESAGLKANTNESRGSDPYNTSGSFDRTKNWTRVGKR